MNTVQTAPAYRRVPGWGVVRQELEEFCAFLRRPQRGKGRHSVGWVWAARVAACWLALLLICLPLERLLSSLQPQPQVQLYYALELDQLSGPGLLVLAWVIPVLEELLFRAGLRSSSYSIFLGPVLIAFLYGLRNTTELAIFLLLLLVFCLAWLVHVHRTGWSDSANHQFSRRFVRHFPLVFWLYAIGYALVHVGNYPMEGARGVVVAVLAQVPLLLSGLVLGYVRLRDGLRSSVMLHCLHNTVLLYLVSCAGQSPAWLRLL